VLQLAHQVLLLAFLAALALIPGLALAGRVPGHQLRVLGIGSLLCGYTLLISVMVETGTARLRSPSEPILAAVLVVSLSVVHGVLGERRRDARLKDDRTAA
jgi:hypothetical protein